MQQHLERAQQQFQTVLLIGLLPVNGTRAASYINQSVEIIHFVPDSVPLNYTHFVKFSGVIRSHRHACKEAVA